MGTLDALASVVWLVRGQDITALTISEYCALPGSAVRDSHVFTQRGAAEAYLAQQAGAICGGCGHPVDTIRDSHCPQCGLSATKSTLVFRGISR